MTEAETNSGNKPWKQIDEIKLPGKTDDQKKEEYEAVKARVRQMLFGVSCLDGALKRRRKTDE